MRIFYGNESGDGAGNRKSNKEIKIPHDGVGNYLEHAGQINHVPDNLGNSIESAPTHHLNSSYRKKSEQAPPQRVGRYLVGGVNPIVVAGLSHLIPESPPQVPIENKNQADKRLRRLFEFDEDDRVAYTLTSTLEEKRLQAEEVVKKIFDLGHAPTEVTATLGESTEKPSLTILVKTPLFKNDELPTAALNFLVNKIVNRLHSDRIRLKVGIDN